MSNAVAHVRCWEAQHRQRQAVSHSVQHRSSVMHHVLAASLATVGRTIDPQAGHPGIRERTCPRPRWRGRTLCSEDVSNTERSARAGAWASRPRSPVMSMEADPARRRLPIGRRASASDVTFASRPKRGSRTKVASVRERGRYDHARPAQLGPSLSAPSEFWSTCAG